MTDRLRLDPRLMADGDTSREMDESPSRERTAPRRIKMRTKPKRYKRDKTPRRA